MTAEQKQDIKVRLESYINNDLVFASVTGRSIAIDALAHIESLELQLANSQLEEKISEDVIGKFSTILADICITFKGEEKALHRHSYHDLGEIAKTKMLEIDLLNYALAEASKDVARYRWLRMRDLDTIDQGGLFVGLVPENRVINDIDLDQSIDAAIASPPKG